MSSISISTILLLLVNVVLPISSSKSNQSAFQIPSFAVLSSSDASSSSSSFNHNNRLFRSNLWPLRPKRYTACTSYSSSRGNYADKSLLVSSKKILPKVIVFDLDGCLWSPEMYELLYFSGGRGAPFTVDPEDPKVLRTVGDEAVRLLGDVRWVLSQLYDYNSNSTNNAIQVGISSRTDEPEWAKELLAKFSIQAMEKELVPLQIVFNGPIEIAKDSKIKHFHRICKQCRVQMKDILFFDNELGNCYDVASLGVTVVYCPIGVTKELWKLALEESFPASNGEVVGV